MKVITNVRTVELSFSKDFLIKDRYISFGVVSERLRQMELEQNAPHRAVRNLLYNSRKCNKYNLATVGGVLCIDALNPMAVERASLALKFKII